MLLPFHFLKLQRVRRNTDSQIHAGRVRRSVEERSLHCASDISGHLARGASLHLLFDRVSREQVLRSLFAISTAGADDGPAAIHFHTQRVTSAFGRLGRGIAEDIILRLVVRNSLQASDQIVGINDDKTARSLSQLIEDLLTVCDVRNIGDDLPRLIVLRVSVALACDRRSSCTASAAVRSSSAGSTSSAVFSSSAGSSSTRAAARPAAVAATATTPTSPTTAAVLRRLKIGALQRIEGTPTFS